MEAFFLTTCLGIDFITSVQREKAAREVAAFFSTTYLRIASITIIKRHMAAFLFTIYLRADSSQEVSEVRQCEIWQFYPLQFTFALNTSEYITSIQRYKAALIFTIYHRVDLITSVQSEKAV